MVCNAWSPRGPTQSARSFHGSGSLPALASSGQWPARCIGDARSACSSNWPAGPRCRACAAFLDDGRTEVIGEITIRWVGDGESARCGSGRTAASSHMSSPVQRRRCPAPPHRAKGVRVLHLKRTADLPAPAQQGRSCCGQAKVYFALADLPAFVPASTPCKTAAAVVPATAWDALSSCHLRHPRTLRSSPTHPARPRL